MTQDEIIEMAKQTGGIDITNNYVGITVWLGTDRLDFLQDFAKLVAEKERERMTVVAMDAAEKAVDVAIKLEREACAKLVEDSWMAFSRTPNRRLNITPFPELEYVAKVIRARGQA